MMTFFVVPYLAGVLTIVSPSILPILPFVVARAGQSFSTGILPMLLGRIVSFAGIASLAALGGNWAVEANMYGRHAAIALLAVFGVTLLSTRAATFVAIGSRLSRDGNHRGGGTRRWRDSARGWRPGCWAPCAGPVVR